MHRPVPSPALIGKYNKAPKGHSHPPVSAALHAAQGCGVEMHNIHMQLPVQKSVQPSCSRPLHCPCNTSHFLSYSLRRVHRGAGVYCRPLCELDHRQAGAMLCECLSGCLKANHAPFRLFMRLAGCSCASNATYAPLKANHAPWRLITHPETCHAC